MIYISSMCPLKVKPIDMDSYCFFDKLLVDLLNVERSN